MRPRHSRVLWLALLLAAPLAWAGERPGASPEQATVSGQPVQRQLKVQQRQVRQLDQQVKSLETRQQQAQAELAARDARIAELQRQLRAAQSVPAGAGSSH